MHTFRYRVVDPATPEVTFTHNGDFSGDVIIAVDSDMCSVRVSFAALKAFVAEYIRAELISRLEDASIDELLQKALK